MVSKGAKVALVLAAGAAVATVALAKAQVPPSGAPRGSVGVTLQKGNSRLNQLGDELVYSPWFQKTLYALPNDVTILVVGNVISGTAPITAQIIVEAITSGGATINIATFSPSTQYSPGQQTQYSRFMTPADLLALVGAGPNYTIRARFILTNAIGSFTSTSGNVSFTVNAPAPPPPPPGVAPFGAAGLTVSKMQNRAWRE